MLGVLLLLFIVVLMLGVTHYVLPKVVEANTQNGEVPPDAPRSDKEAGPGNDPA